MVVARKILFMLAIFHACKCSDTGQNIMKNNSLSIHIESGDIFCNDFNIKENFYNFLLGQQGECTQFTPKTIFCQYSFEKYTRNYLPSFSIDEVEKLDTLSNKNAKYLLYKFNGWTEWLDLWEQNKY